VGDDGDWRKGLDQWFKITCYLGFVWVFIDVLPHLPVHIVERIIDGLLSKVGL